MLYAIKSDTLFFNRQANRVDIEAFSYLYPLADAALIRKMEGAEITVERLEYVLKAYRGGSLVDQVFCGFLGPSPREDFIPYVADFFLQMEDVKWTIVAGIVNDSLSVSLRNLGYSKNAGEFARRVFADIGNGAVTGRWRRPWCRCAHSGKSSGTFASKSCAEAARAHGAIPT